MVRVPTEVTAAQRARWLAELTKALEEAQNLIGQLCMAGVRDLDALDLSARVEAAREEVQSLRLRRADKSSSDSHRNWTDSVPWDEQAEQNA